MHRSAFRPRKAAVSLREVASPANGKDHSDDFAALREQIANITSSIGPLRGTVEKLAAPKEDVTVPGDISQSLKLVHNRLDRLEQENQRIADQQQKMATTFSNALLKLSDKVEKYEGELAHSLDKLTQVLSARKLRIIRDNNGDMASVEVTTGNQE
ncbi:MAG TPA: hypothetical protein VIY48_19960 [Candidatus Paceibacterota bacterium]